MHSIPSDGTRVHWPARMLVAGMWLSASAISAAQSPPAATRDTNGATLPRQRTPISAPGTDTTGAGGYTALVRGFVSMGINWDQHDMGSSEPLFPPPGQLPSTLRFTANQSQIGVGLKAPPSSGGLTNVVYAEFDFLSETAPGHDRVNERGPRMRHAFWRMGWNGDRSTLLVGQTNNLFGDLIPNLPFDNLSLSLGTIYGREPQVRYTTTHELSRHSGLIVGASVNAPNSGYFNENTGTAERSALPSVQGRIAYYSDRWGGVNYFGFENVAPSPLVLAVSGFGGQEVGQRLAGDTKRVVTDGVAVSAMVPIIGIRENRRAGSLGLMAEGWIGKNIDNYFGGNGQGIYETATGTVDGIGARGFFASTNYSLTQNIWLSGSYSYEKNNLDDLVHAGTPFRIASGLFSGQAFGAPGVAHAQDAYGALWFAPLPSLFVSVGWDYRSARYNEGQEGRNNRVNIAFFYNFCSVGPDRPTGLPWPCARGGRAAPGGDPRAP